LVGSQTVHEDSDYFAWQRQRLAPETLAQLNALVERKREGARRDDIAFYDLAADPTILPVLYSQRYGYFEAVGSRVAARLDGAKRVLDFGCGAGILTTFYARRYPQQAFVGIDRSPSSVGVARQKARELGLTNVRFDCVDAEVEPLAGSYPVIVSTQALLQAEHDPGLPSANWRTFERLHDAGRQAAFEQRTGLGVRLDRVGAVLDRDGLMIICEKTRQLARRVPFQRALAARDLQIVEPPEPLRYSLVEEVVDDGPLYRLQKGKKRTWAWNESPEPDDGMPFNPSAIGTKACGPGEPLYENHRPSAQRMWEQLQDRRIREETTRQEPDGRQLHVELGLVGDLAYLYCANTFDQRQLVIVDRFRIPTIEAYYREIVGGSW